MLKVNYVYNLVQRLTVFSVVHRVFFGILVHPSTVDLSETEGPLSELANLSKMFLEFRASGWA